MFLLLAIVMVAGCVSYQGNINNKNVAHIYNPSFSSLNPEYKLYHQNDSISVLFFKVKTDELLFVKNQEQIEEAKIELFYATYKVSGSYSIQDSISTIITVDRSKVGEGFVSYLPIVVKDTVMRVMEVVMSDLYRNKWNRQFIYIDKSSYNSQQNFLVLSEKYDAPSFSNDLPNDEVFNISTRKKSKKIYVKYFKQLGNYPLPPFSLLDKKEPVRIPDSVWVSDLSDTTTFSLPHKGLYFFQLDTNVSEGLTLCNRGRNFPLQATPSELLEPLKYLNANKNFKLMKMASNKKISVDNYWLDVAGNPDRARELIKIYYNRCRYANEYFSSNVEGWKTDRGMIYTIFGVPKAIYKSGASERWIYNESHAGMNFVFAKIENQYSDNHYVLQRNEIYKTAWYQAIDTWRNGMPYSISK